jgi:electron transport complex protein RnfA
MNSAWLALLAFFSGLSVNLILQCGFGMAGIAVYQGQKLPLIKTGLGFITIIFLWFFFFYVLSPVSMGFFGYLLLFPSASLVYSGFEYLLFSLILKKEPGEDLFFHDGLVGAALFLTVSLSNSFTEAAVLAFGFTAGILLCLLILGEIRKRSGMEAVPKFLRGRPLILVSMGLLSLIFGSAAAVLFRALGGMNGG